MFPCVPLLPQYNNIYEGSKTNCMILPVSGKLYHIERNFDNDMIINIINSSPATVKEFYIIKKDNYQSDLTDIQTVTDKKINILDDNYK